jgi:hypothetical protein
MGSKRPVSVRRVEKESLFNPEVRKGFLFDPSVKTVKSGRKLLRDLHPEG